MSKKNYLLYGYTIEESIESENSHYIGYALTHHTSVQIRKNTLMCTSYIVSMAVMRAHCHGSAENSS